MTVNMTWIKKMPTLRCKENIEVKEMLVRQTRTWHETWNQLSAEPEGKPTQARKQTDKHTT